MSLTTLQATDSTHRLVERVTTADGRDLALYQVGRWWVIRIDGRELMASSASLSEQALAHLACREVAHLEAPRILIGGLGMGYTLRAALRTPLPEGARVTVAEVFDAVVAWNRGPLAELAERPLDDPRVEVEVADVRSVIAQGGWDAILLDVDNGPEPLTLLDNARLYVSSGVRRLRDALRPGGVLAVWSATPDEDFTRRLEKAGFTVHTEAFPAHPGDLTAEHTIFLARHAP